MQQYLTYLCTDINETGPSRVIFMRVDQFYVLRFLFCRVYIMDLEVAFRNLLTDNFYDPYLRIYGLNFSFKTACQMFPGPHYTLYRGCPCSIEHEFMLYWKNGAIDIDILNRVAQNITNGKCPHVQETTPSVVSSVHYENMSVQYTAIFHGYKNDYFQMKNCNIFLIFAQNIDCWYTLEPPQ